MKVYQIIDASQDQRFNLLLNVFLWMSVPPMGCFAIYFILSAILIWVSALFVQFFTLLFGLVFLVPALFCSMFLSIITTVLILTARSRWHLTEKVGKLDSKAD